MGEDGVAEAAGDFAGEVEGDLFAADGFQAVGEVAVSGDPGADGGIGLGAVDADEDGAAGVFAGEVADDGGVFEECAGFFGVDDEVHQRGVGAGVVLFPEFAEFAVDFGDGDFEAEFRAEVWDGGGHGAVGGGLSHGLADEASVGGLWSWVWVEKIGRVLFFPLELWWGVAKVRACG